MSDPVPALSSYFTALDIQPRFLLLYGSETGNAEAISAEMVEQAAALGITADRHVLNDTDRRFNIERERCVVIVTSTTGEGDPPDNAVKFVKRITKRTLPNDYLKNVHVTVLGLGDSNYSDFCNCAKTVWTALMSLGASEFYASGWADDATGLEMVVDPWIDGLWEPLLILLKSIHEESNLSPRSIPVSNGLTDKFHDHVDHVDGHLVKDSDGCDCDMCSASSLENEDLTIPNLTPTYLQIQYENSPFDTSKIPVFNGRALPSAASNVVMASVVKVTQLSRDDAVKKALEIELDVGDSEFTYRAGDSFSILCQNDNDEVKNLLAILKLTAVADSHYVLKIDPETKKRAPSIPKHIPEEGTLRYVLTHCCDIRTVPKKAFIRALVECTESDKEKRRLQELCSKEGQNDYAKFLRQPSLGITDILTHFKSCKPSIELLFEHLTPLLPRPYSASSSSMVEKNRVKFLFNVVKMDKSEGRTYDRLGVCTGWLEKLCKSDGIIENEILNLSLKDSRIPIFMRTHCNFHLPSDITIPVIMIGPGTGVAPFIGFLSERQEMMKNSDERGKLWLFFGCRHREKDYFYKNEIQEFLNKVVLNKLSVCFSRDRSESEPKYVQDVMSAEKESLVQWLDDGAHVYVCGDAKNMAKDVFEQFVSLVSVVKKISEKDARAFMMTKRLKKSYHEDIWT